MSVKGIRLRVLGVVFLAAALGGGLALSRRSARALAASDPPAIPVTAQAAKVQDVPVYLRGLGTVQAFNTVEIKAQVNGTLIALPVREGQEVQQGDIVAEIDPRPYQGGAGSGHGPARRGRGPVAERAA